MAQNVPKTKGVQASPCPRICQLVPTNVPGPRQAQAVLHPRKDVFVLRWSSSFGIAVNPSKCQAIIVGSPRQLLKLDSVAVAPITFEGSIIPVSGQVKDLGVVIDKHLSWNGQLSEVAKIGTMGERRLKMELELVTPKGPERKVPSRIDTKGTQCLPPPCPGCCQRVQC